MTARAPSPNGSRRRCNGEMPGSVHAGQYSAVTHYLKAVVALGPDKAKASGRAVIEQMKATPTDDPLFGKGKVRKDGRVIHDMYLFEVKSPAAIQGTVGLLHPEAHGPGGAGVPPDGRGRLHDGAGLTRAALPPASLIANHGQFRSRRRHSRLRGRKIPASRR